MDLDWLPEDIKVVSWSDSDKNQILHETTNSKEGLVMTPNMTVDERISLCRFLEKLEDQETYCTSIGVRDVSRFRGKEIVQRNRVAQKNRKRI